MTDLNKVVKVALIALTMLVGAQGASADDVATVVENTKAPFGFATRSSRTEATAYNITGGGVYTVDAIKTLIGGQTKNKTFVADGKNVIVLTSNGTTSMDATILSAITANDIIVFDGSDHTDFLVDEQITLSDLSNKTLIGLNGARLCTTWHITDVIKNWLNSVETSSGSGVSNASTASGTGGSITLKNVAGEDSITIAIDEEGEYLTRKTLAERGAAANPSTSDLAWEQYYFLRNERYRKSGIFYIQRCENVIIRNLSFQGPGSVDVGGVDLVSVINSSHHIWVDHCEFIDGQDGNFDITNESDYITASWCHFRYTDRSYVHQNTNLVGSSDSKVADRGKLNITFAYNEWGENCRSRMPMGRFGKIHLLNNWYNCSGNTENAVNPRLESEYLIEGNYFDKGIIKTFKNNGSTGVSISDNTVADPAGGSISASGSAVTVPYTYNKVPSTSVPEMIELLVGPLLDKEPTFTINPDDTPQTPSGQYTLNVSTDRATQGLTFSVWADYAMSYQWYRAEKSDLSDAVAIEGAIQNGYTYSSADEEEFYLFCEAVGLAGTARSNKIKIKIQGEGAPVFFKNITSYVKSAYTAITGTPFSGLSVYAGNNVTCQWYRSETAVSDTTAVGVTKLVGKTEQTLTFTPTAEDKARESDYYFCVVRRPNDPTLFAISNIARVKYAAGAYLIKFIADLEEPDATDLQGITFCGKAAVATGNNGYKSNKQALKAIQLTSNYASGKADGTNSIKLSVAGGFKTGDKVTISGYYSNKDTKVTQVDLFTLGDKNAADTLATTGPVINGRTTDDDATTVEYELEADAEYLYLGRVGGTATNVSRILVSRGDLAEPVAPYIKTQPADVSDAMAKSASVLTIEAEDATNYAWYSNTSASTEGATAIDGQTTASCKYTPAAAGTTYVYCVVTNDPTGTGDPVKSVTSRFAEVVATPAINVPLDSLICFIADGNDPDANDLKGITRVDETNTIIAEVKYKTNSTALKVIQLSKSYSTGKVDGQYSVKLTCTGGFKKGDVITVAGYINSGDAAKYGAIDIFTLDGSNQYVGGKYLYRTENFIDGKIVDDDPVDYTYTLTEDANVVYLGRYGNTKTNISKILVTREKKFVEKAIYTTTFQDWTADAATDGNNTYPGDHYSYHNAVTTTKENFKFTVFNTSVRPNNSSDSKRLNQNGATIGDLYGHKESSDDKKATITTDTITVNKISKIKFIHGATSTNRGWGLKVWGTQETGVRDADWVTVWSTTADTQRGTVVTVEGINRTNCKIQFYNLSKGNYAYMSDLVIYAMVEDKTCNDPTYETPAPEWQEATEKWRYTMTSTTESARLRYTLNGGETQSVESNTVTLDLTPGTAVKVWAIDSNEELENSNEVTFTVKAQPKAAQPTITVGDVTMPAKTFPVTIAVTDGGTIHYTTDGSTPTASSPTYSATINVAANATVKTINVKEHYANSNESQATTLALSNPTGDEQILISHNPHNADGSINYSSNINKGVSYTVEATYNAGSYSSAENTGIKYNAGRDVYVGGVKKTGFQIDVNDGFVIKKLVIKNLCSNGTTGTAETINNIYADNSTTDIRGGEASDIVLPFSDKTPLEITLDNINARDSITFVCTPGSAKQIRAIVDVYYAIEEAPVSFTINGGEPISKDDFIDRVYSIPAATDTYEDNPTIVMTTTKGFQYTLQYEGAEKEGDKLSKFSYSILDEKWTVKVRVTGVNAPLISIDEASGIQFYKKEGVAKGGYKVTLTDIKEEEGVVPYIIIDPADPENPDYSDGILYNPEQEYYALKNVATYCEYQNAGTQRTSIRSLACPVNPYSASKPFAAFIYQEGFADGGAGQGEAESANSYDPSKDQVHLGLADKFNVIDYHFSSADGNAYTVTEKFPGIQNAKLVVLSEMIGGSGSYVDAEGTNTNSTKMVMSFRDELVGHTNVLNMKMFFYSQSQNNYQRWSWAQPAALNNTVLSIKPTNTLYKVFENVSLSMDGSIALFKPIDDENTLNHFQMVHNFNEENEALPNFVRLATAVNTDGEEYEALHYFEKNGYTYVGTGISINDYLNYDENLGELVSTIGQMIINGTSLGTVMDYVPAPRIRDNGNGSATISNNNPTAVTYYRTSASDSEEWDADDIKSANTTTKDGLTTKSSTDVWVYAISDVGGSLSQIAKAKVVGNSYRYVHRTTDDAEAQGKEANVRFEAKTGPVTVTIPYNQSFSKPGYTVTSWKDKYNPATTYTPGDVVETDQDIYLVAVWTKNTKKITDTNTSQTVAQRTVTWNFRQGDGAPAMKLEQGSTTVGQKGILVGQMVFSDTPGDFIDVAMTINADGSVTMPDNGGETHTGKFDNTSTSYTDVNKDKYLSDFAQVRSGTTFTFPAVYGMQVRYKQATFEKYDDKTNNVREKSQSYVSQSILTDGTLTNPGLELAENGAVALTNGVSTITDNGEDNLANGGLFNYTSKTDTLATLTSKESARYIAPQSPATTTKTVGGLNFGSVFMESLSVTYPSLYDLTTQVEFKSGHINILPNKEELTPEQTKQRAVKVTLSDAPANCNGRYKADTEIAYSITPGYSFYFEGDGSTNVIFDSEDGTESGLNPSIHITDNKKTAWGTFTIQPNTVAQIWLTQNTVHAFNTAVMPLSTGSLRIDSQTGKAAEDEYTMFPNDSIITMTPTPKIGYKFDRWTNAEGAVYGTDTPWPAGITVGDRGKLTITVSNDNAAPTYVAVFEPGLEGTVHYQLPWAGLYINDNEYAKFGGTLAPGTPESVDETRYKYAWQYTKYHFPASRTTTALYIPTCYTLYVPGYTMKNWAHIVGFDPENPEEKYDEGVVTEYNIGTYYYFDEARENRYIIPIFKENTVNFDYRTTPADITWDFRTAYMAQRLYFDTATEFDYATHATINKTEENPDGIVIDVPLHINGVVDNTSLDEWCHFDEGTVITIPSGLGAKFTLVTYHKLSSTTIDGEVPLEYTMRTENDIPVYYYNYTTHSTKTSIDLVIGKDHTYFKYIRAQLPAADAVKLTTTTNNEAWGNSELVKVSTTEANINNDNVGSDVDYTTDGNVYTLPLGSYVKVKATRERLYELKAFVIDGDTISVITAKDLEAAAANGYTITKPADNSTAKEYTLKFRMETYSTTVEAVYGNRLKWQITYSPGAQAAGEAPGVAVVENGEAFTMPAKNQTLYLEGYTLKYWMDENGIVAVNADGSSTGENKYEWGKEYLPSADLYLTPVFEINDFTLFDIPSTGATVEWPLATGKDIVKYGNAPLLKYQKSSGVYVSQLTLADGRYIDLDLKIDCSESGAKVDNSAADYRCQINAASKITVPTNKKTTISVVTANGQMSTTKIAGAIGSKGGTSSTSYGSGSKDDTEGAGTNDYSYSVSYTGEESSQNIEFMGDAGYFKMIKAEYGKVSSEGLPQLDYVTVNNIALGSFGTDFEAYTINALKNSDTHSMDIAMKLSTTAAMPVVKAKADQNDAVVTVIQPTKEAPTATIIVKTAKGATVAIYKLDFEITYISTTAPELQRVEMNNLLVKARDVNGTMQTYLEEGTKMSVNGAVSITFDHEMMATDTINTSIGKVVASGGKTLTFRYWNLDVDKDYTFTVPASALKDVYGTAYIGEDISFTFHTAATSMHIDKRKVNFVVTHKQAHTFNSTKPTENYTSGVKRQVASDELIANLAKDGIAYGTIDEGLAMAHAAGGTDRFYIFVPDGEYQIKGNTPTGAITAASSSNGAAPADNSGALRDDLMGKQIYNGMTTITRENLSITGQSEANTKLFNRPEIEGISYTSTFFVNGVTGFYVQDMTLTNAFDYKTSMASQGSNSAQAARGVVLRDRGLKTIMKNVTMDSWQDTYYSNGSNQYSDSRGYFEDCTIKGYVDFFCGDGDHWFERCNLILRNGKAGNASNMMAPRTYATQLWGYVFNNCEITAEDETTFNTCNNKFTLARPWSNSPAATFLYTKYNVLPSADGYKQMSSSGLVLRFHEYGSTDGNGALIDLSTRSMRASSPGAGSYAPVMTPAEAAEYTVHNALGGTDGYDPTIYTAQVSMEKANLTSVDRSLSWDGQSEALCYFIFRKTESGSDELFAITEDTSYELDDAQIGRTFIVRAANQRGGLGEPSNEFVYEVHESYKLTLTTSQQAPIYNSSTGKNEDWCWSTVYLDYNAKAPVIDDGGTISDVYVYAVVDVTPISMTLKRVNILEKNQGYIVKGKPGTFTFSYTDSDGEYHDHTVTVAGSLAASENRMSVLDGVVQTVERAGKEVYTLYYKANYGLGFYTYTGEYLNANRAYLDGSYVGTGGTGSIVISGSSNSTGFIFLDDEATSINRIDSAADDDSDRIYTVYGQRVKRSEMIKGRVYIVNGRKIAY